MFMFFAGMGQFLQRLREGHPAYKVVAAEEGFSLVRLDGEEDRFNDLAREIINHSGDDFVAFPTPDGATGYESVYVLPLE